MYTGMFITLKNHEYVYTDKVKPFITYYRYISTSACVCWVTSILWSGEGTFVSWCLKKCRIGYVFWYKTQSTQTRKRCMFYLGMKGCKSHVNFSLLATIQQVKFCFYLNNQHCNRCCNKNSCKGLMAEHYYIQWWIETAVQWPKTTSFRTGPLNFSKKVASFPSAVLNIWSWATRNKLGAA